MSVETTREWRKRNKEYTKEYDRWRNQLPEIKERHNELSKQWRRKNWDKVRLAEHKRWKNIDRKWRGYIESTKTRGHTWELTKEDFILFLYGDCAYCGIPTAMGIDRVNNDVGYMKKNCISCCKQCNYAKHKQTVDEFLDMVKRIAIYRLGAKFGENGTRE